MSLLNEIISGKGIKARYSGEALPVEASIIMEVGFKAIICGGDYGLTHNIIPDLIRKNKWVRAIKNYKIPGEGINVGYDSHTAGIDNLDWNCDMINDSVAFHISQNIKNQKYTKLWVTYGDPKKPIEIKLKPVSNKIAIYKEADEAPDLNTYNYRFKVEFVPHRPDLAKLSRIYDINPDMVETITNIKKISFETTITAVVSKEIKGNKSIVALQSKTGNTTMTVFA